MKSCFGYIRVSTQKQGEGVSLEAQKDAILACATARGLRVIEWFEEKETAAKSGRPVFNRMLRELKRGRASGLIIHKIDRSARNLRDWAIVSELPDIGVDVHIATETLDFRSRGGRLTADIQAVIAADYIRNLREETIKGITGRLKQGLYPFRAPLGYLDNGRGKPKTICPAKGPLVRKAFELYASGRYPMRQLQAEMARRGLRNHSGKPLSLHGIESVLRNPFYCGLIEVRASNKTFPGVHEPLIDTKLYRLTRDIRAGRVGKKVTRHDHLYQGLFRCGLCNRPMTPERQKGRVYYRCQEAACPTKTVREDDIQKRVMEKFAAIQLSTNDAKRLRAAFHCWIGSAERLADRASIELQIANVDARIDRLTDLLVDGQIAQSDFERRKTSLALERKELSEALLKEQKSELLGAKLEKYIELMKNLTELHENARRDEKRTMLRALCSNLRVVEKRVEIEPKNWLFDRDFSDLSPLVTHLDTLIELAPSLPQQVANDNTIQMKQQLSG
ncbi:MAG: recombinase family protein [Beijerinckiaceae bacterium]